MPDPNETNGPRPATTPTTSGVASVVVVNISTIATYIVGLYLPPDLPGNVRLSIEALTLSAVAFIMAMLGSYLRNAEWAANGTVSGFKKLLLLPLVLSVTLPLMSCATDEDHFYRGVQSYNVLLEGAASWMESPASQCCPEEKAKLKRAVAAANVAINEAHHALNNGTITEEQLDRAKTALADALEDWAQAKAASGEN